jgi:amino acid transporter
LQDDYLQFARSTKTYKPFTLLAFAQPIPAIISLVGCGVAFAFCSSTWWSTPVTFSKVAIGYAAVSVHTFSKSYLHDVPLTRHQPIILLGCFIIFKLINRRLWIRTGTDFAVLSSTLDRLRWYKPDEVSPREQHREETRVLSPPMATSSTVLDGSAVGESPKMAQVTTSGYAHA